MIASSFEERIKIELGETAPIDHERFRDLCLELEVWEEEEPDAVDERMLLEFGYDACSAISRFYEVWASLDDPELAEFQCSTDDGRIETPFAIFEAAAVVPLVGEPPRLDRTAWFAEIMRRLPG